LKSMQHKLDGQFGIFFEIFAVHERREGAGDA